MRKLTDIDVILQAQEVLGPVEGEDWLNTHNDALGAPPFRLLETMEGCALVSDILTRIEHGIPS